MASNRVFSRKTNPYNGARLCPCAKCGTWIGEKALSKFFTHDAKPDETPVVVYEKKWGGWHEGKPYCKSCLSELGGSDES